MHIENDGVRPDTDDLDAFDNLFNSRVSDDEPKTTDGDADDVVENEAEDVEDVDSEVEEEEVEEADDSGDDDSPATEEDEDDDEEDEKPRRKLTARERVEQAVARQREAEREAAELRIKLELLEKNKQESEPEPKQAPTKQPLEEEAPSSDAVDEDGELIYPLGDLDPAYIRDLTKWAAKKANDELRAEQEAEQRQRQQEEANRQLVENWQQKLAEAEADLPDVREKGQRLEQTFRDIDPDYGQALAATIMSLDYGPHVLDYLADNIQEAKDIVNSDPLKAVLKLGSLNERLSTIYAKGDNKPKKKVSSAPPPAPSNKGAMRTKQIRPDTDNLDDFDKLFNKR